MGLVVIGEEQQAPLMGEQNAELTAAEWRPDRRPRLEGRHNDRDCLLAGLTMTSGRAITGGLPLSCLC